MMSKCAAADLGEPLARYLHRVLGVVLRVRAWRGTGRLPPFLSARYRFLEGQLLDRAVLFMMDDSSAEESPATIRKHVEHAEAKCDRAIIYVRGWITAYNRQRLIQLRVPFVVPGNQMYLPALGIDLRERMRRAPAGRTRFRPSTQGTFIRALLDERHEVPPAADLAQQLGYSAMTLSRAFDELESAGLARARSSTGRARLLAFTAPRAEVWRQAAALLSSPVRRRHFVAAGRGEIPGLTAGLSALAHYSSMAAPDHAVVAMGAKEWAAYRWRQEASILPVADSQATVVEVWSYPPRPYRDPGVVDPLSLFLSLRDERDERVEMALDEMMEGLRW